MYLKIHVRKMVVLVFKQKVDFKTAAYFSCQQNENITKNRQRLYQGINRYTFLFVWLLFVHSVDYDCFLF